MALEIQKAIPALAPLDPPDWTTEDIVRHLGHDVLEIAETLEKALRDKQTDKLLNDIQNFHGRVRSWLRLYSIVTKQELEPINM